MHVIKNLVYKNLCSITCQGGLWSPPPHRLCTLDRALFLQHTTPADSDLASCRRAPPYTCAKSRGTVNLRILVLTCHLLDVGLQLTLTGISGCPPATSPSVTVLNDVQDAVLATLPSLHGAAWHGSAVGLASRSASTTRHSGRGRQPGGGG